MAPGTPAMVRQTNFARRIGQLTPPHTTLQASGTPTSATKSATKSAAKTPQNPGGLTEFELQRQRRIEENQKRLLALGIIDTKNAIEKAAAAKRKPATASQRGLPKKRIVVPEAERRRSSRIKGDAADGNEVTEELRGGKVVTKDMVPAEPEGPHERHSKVDIPFKSTDATEATEEADAETLEVLRATPCAGEKATSAKTKKKAGTKTKTKTATATGTAGEITSLSLVEKDVAKVTKAGTVHLSFMPGSSEILAAADKKGGVGIWRVNAEEREGAFDGVHYFAPHAQYVSGLVWGERSNSQLVTASYDGSVRLLDVEAGVFSLAYSDDDAEFSAMNMSEHVVYLGTNTGYLDAIDLRCPDVIHSLHASLKKINTVDIDVRGTGHFLTCSSTDCTVKVFDTRKILKTTAKPSANSVTKPVLLGSHERACQGAYFAPDGSGRIVSTSFDDTVRVWDSRNASGGVMSESLSIKHNNNTGRWVFPFRAVWSADASSVVIGNMNRYLDVFSATTGRLTCQGSEPELMTAIPSRNCVSDDGTRIAAATASGRLHVYTVR